MFALLSFIPGIGPILGIAGGVVNFILSCRICMIALGLLAVFIVGDVRGRHVEAAKWKAADLAMQLAATQRDARIKSDLALFAQAEAARLRLENQGLQRQIDDVAAHEKNRPSACLLGPDDLKRLEAIK